MRDFYWRVMRKYNLLCDFDTALVSAAAGQQQNTIVATFNANGKSKPFDNRTAFKAWLKDNPKWTSEQFTITDKRTVVGSARKAVDGLLTRMSNISESAPVNTVKFVIGGVHGNFRDSVARIQPYKGQRAEKPLLFNDIKKLLIKEIGQYILQPQGSFESDDLASMYLAKEVHIGEDSDSAISSPDKDLKMCVGWHTDANDWGNAATYTKEFAGFRHLMVQALTGDKVDNIQGIPKLVESVQKRFGLRKTSGFGLVSAEGCLKDADTQEELVSRIAYVYKETFQDGLTLPCGEVLTWVEVMDENIQLLKMLDYEGQVYKFSKEWNINE